MVALPLFWDQYDNAQRVHETGFGHRLPTYEFDDADLLGALEQLLDDAALRERMALIAGRVQSSPGTERAAALIEQLASPATPPQG
jgi:UDP:flavonoid glycosyltransferase YjiC (YdhE family)